MRAIGFISRKGGVGKTTIAVHLAIKAATRGAKVAFIDCDTGLDSAAEYFELGERQDITYMRLGRNDLIDTARSFYEQGYDYLFVDVGGWDTEDVRVVASMCGLVIMPLVPTGISARGLIKTKHALDEALAEGIKLNRVHLVMSQAQRNTKALAKTRASIEAFNLPIFETVIYRRSAFEAAEDAGFKGVTEIPSNQSSGEITRLLAEIDEVI